MSESAKGALAMILACMVWGVFPYYFNLLSHLPPLEVLAHRLIWSFVVFAVILAVQGQAPLLWKTLRRGWMLTLGAALLITVNWFLFIYAVGTGRATESSLGYYLFPLLAVLLGAAFLGERPKQLQWLAIALAALAVAVLTVGLGVAPWIAIILAVTFAGYGLLKRRVKVGPVVSVTAEVALLMPFGVAVLIHAGGGAGAQGSAWDMALLVASGPLTVIPMILFSYAARRVAYGTIGVLQYLNPTLQFGCAVLLLGEPFGTVQLIAFSMIWTAVALYSWVALSAARKAART